jgi:hypothetical protein
VLELRGVPHPALVPEYERIRRDDALFVVLPGHETGMTTERTERYVVVTAPPGS